MINMTKGPMRSVFQKRHYLAMAAQVREIEAGLSTILDMPLRSDNAVENAREAVMELVVARLGLMCATDNPKFDSFEFNAACRGRRT